MIPTGIFVDGGTGEHRCPGHPERPERMQAMHDALHAEGFLERLTPLTVTPASREMLERVHPAEVLDALESVAAAGGGHLDPDTYLTQDSMRCAMRGSGAAVAGVEAILAGTVRRAFVASRPPGHHASAARAMGFCLVNHVAVAARHAAAVHGARVAIVDIDAHHGNGTQDVFYADGDTLFVSVHQYPFYPGTGPLEETGSGAGAGATINVPLPDGADDDALAAAMSRVIEPAVRRFAPSFLIVSAGFDGHARDPLAGLAYTVTGYAAAMRALCARADEVCDGRLLAVGEGGYDLPALGACTAAAVAVMADLPVPEDPWGVPFGDAPDVSGILDRVVTVHGLDGAASAASGASSSRPEPRAERS